MLFVDDEQAEVLPSHAVLQQAVRADHHVDFSARQAGEYAARLGRAHEPRQHLDLHRIRLEALAESGHVLRREQRGRHEHRRLLAVLHTLEHRAQRHLGLAESDVAADETIHRACCFHIALHFDDRLQLVGSLDVRETGFHFLLPRRVGGERVPGRVQTTLVQDDEFLGDRAQLVAHALLGAREIRAAHLVERWSLATHVLAHEVDLVAQHEQVAVGVANVQEVALDAVEFAPRHALESPHAVHVMHDEVARRQVFEHRRSTTSARPTTSTAATTGDLSLGGDEHAGERQGESVVQCAHDHAHYAVVDLRRVAVEQARRHTMRGEFVAHSRRRLAAVVGEHDFVADSERVTHSLCQRIARGRR